MFGTVMPKGIELDFGDAVQEVGRPRSHANCGSAVCRRDAHHTAQCLAHLAVGLVEVFHSVTEVGPGGNVYPHAAKMGWPVGLRVSEVQKCRLRRG